MSGYKQIDLDEIRSKLRQIEADSRSGNDGMALWVVTNLILYTGLKLNEITKLMLEDFSSNNNIVNQITLNRQRPVQFPLPQNIQLLLTNYLQNLRSEPLYSAADSSHPFSTYSDESGKKKLDRHYEKYRTGFMELRRAGIIFFNRDCFQNDHDLDRKKAMDRATEKTIRHFHVTERTVEDYLRNIHRPAGRRKGEKRTLDDRAADFFEGLGHLTAYEIFVENKVSELVTEMEELFGDSVAKNILLEWLYTRVHDHFSKMKRPVTSQNSELPQSPANLLDQIKRGTSNIIMLDSQTERAQREAYDSKNKPKYNDLSELKQMIFDLVDQGKQLLGPEGIANLKEERDKEEKEEVSQKGAKPQKANRAYILDILYREKLKQQIAEELRKKERGRKLYGAIWEVNQEAKYIMVRFEVNINRLVKSLGLKKVIPSTNVGVAMPFFVEDTTRITKDDKDRMVFEDLKKGMDVIVRSREMDGRFFAKAIVVRTPKSAGKGKVREIPTVTCVVALSDSE